MLLAAGLLGLATAVLLAGHAEAPARLRAVGLSAAPPARSGAVVTPHAASLVAAVAVALLIGWPIGLLPALAILFAGPVLLGRLEPRSVRVQREQLVAELPLALDLLAACLAGGASPAAATAAVAVALPGPCGPRFAAVASALGVGSGPTPAWAALAGNDPEDPLAPVARLLARASEGGAPVAGSVTRLAADARALARSAGERAARRVGVLAVAPLGLCFLPAFVLLGVVPVVVGLARPLLAGF